MAVQARHGMIDLHQANPLSDTVLSVREKFPMNIEHIEEPMSNKNPVRVMFVCAGNICRSPMAEAVFRHLVTDAGLAEQFEIASSGTGGWHVGERPHPGTQAVLQRNHVPLDDKRAQQLGRADFQHYDYILVADEENLQDIQFRYNPTHPKLWRLLEFAPESGKLNVPDPYYSGGFDEVYELVLAGSTGLLAYIREQENL
jgi:protein-tyrosine phosphatase